MSFRFGELEKHKPRRGGACGSIVDQKVNLTPLQSIYITANANCHNAHASSKRGAWLSDSLHAAASASQVPPYSLHLTDFNKSRISVGVQSSVDFYRPL